MQERIQCACVYQRGETICNFAGVYNACTTMLGSGRALVNSCMYQRIKIVLNLEKFLSSGKVYQGGTML